MVFRPVLASIVATALSQRPSLDEYEQGKQNAADDEKAKAAVEAKMAAVNKVINMITDLQKQVLDEGEKEAASYEKFACFCKDTTTEKSDAIVKGTDEQNALTAQIGSLSDKRNELDDRIDTLTKSIEELEKEMKKATKERKEILGVYEANAADLSAALEALEGAIEVLKSSKNPSLVQLNSIAKTVRTAAALADALGLEDSAKIQRNVGFFLQQDPSVPMENYKFHSGGVIETLENLQNDFRNEKQGLDKEEVESVAEHDAFMQEKIDITKAENLQLDDAKKARENTISDLAMASEELTTTSADLLDDKQYAAELAQMCTDKAKTWDQRSKVRSDELSAITAALTIIKGTVKEKTSAATVRFVQQGVSVRMAERVVANDLAMEAIEAASEEAEAAPAKAPVAFLQRLVQRHQASPEDGRQAVINMLKTSGAKLHSTLLTSLASQISADPFAKIKKLIQELIERLLTEAANEANQKGWCDKATADAKQRRDYAADEVERLNGEMANLEALRNKLTEETAVLSEEIAELNKKQKEATQMRNEEKVENEATVVEAEAGLEAVNMAIDILDKFYKTAAKEEVDLGLLQGPADDAPDAGFDIGEAYTGAGGEAGGILGMLDVIKSDFERTISETEKAEDKAATEYREFMTATGKSLAEKRTANDEKTKQKDAAIQDLEDANANFQAQAALLNSAVAELVDLRPTCIDTGMSYEERVARREDEIESLKKALCVLKNYQEFGPEGAGNNC
jgi:chromosome segregation ATPase